MSLTYTLVRECLNNVEDIADRWQIEGGKVMQRERHVANYSSVKRVSCGTHEQNTAMLWITLFFLKGRPPENMTLHGAHDFNSGGEIATLHVRGGLSGESNLVVDNPTLKNDRGELVASEVSGGRAKVE